MARKKIKKTNSQLIKLIEDLKTKSRDEGVSIWRDIARRLEKPTRNYAEVNLSQINLHTGDGETVIVPGKVLGSGTLNHTVKIAALGFSTSAKEKISEKGEYLSIKCLMEENPRGSGIRIIR